MLNNYPRLRSAIVIIAVVVIVLALVGVVLTSLGTARMGVSSLMVSDSYAPEMKVSSGFARPVSTPSAALVNPRDVIQTAWLELVVEKTESVVTQIVQVAKTNGGFVESSQINETVSGAKSGNLTLRVPATKLAETLTQIKGLATKVSNERLTSEDVTAQLVDLDARLKNLAVEEESYRGLMSRSGKIDDVLAVTRELSRVRGEIEQLSASRKYISEQVAMSSVNISLTSVAEAQIAGVIWRPIVTIKTALNSLLSGLANLADWLIATIIYLPLLLIKLAILLFILWVIWRVVLWAKKKFISVV